MTTAFSGVRGEAPAYLDTPRENALQNIDTHGDFAPSPLESIVTDPWDAYRPRAYPARPWDRHAWRRAVAVELSSLGMHVEAFRFSGCGRRAWHRDCSCGASPAIAVVFSSCGSRACDFCERRRSQKSARRLAKAMVWLDANSERPDTLRRSREEFRDERDRIALRMRKIENGRPAGRIGRTPLELRRARAARWFYDLANPETWRWRSLTLAVPWSPSDPESYTVGAMRTRLRTLWAQWRALWTWRLAVGGHASASVHAEISTGGHIHLHVLYRGPWVDAQSLEAILLDSWSETEVGRVWVGEVYGTHGDASRECAKYVTKGSGPSSGRWMSGGPCVAIDPVLAARWIRAQGKQQLARHYGRMRIAFTATRPVGRDSEVVDVCSCRACGTSLGEVGSQGWRHDWTDAVARRARERWRSIVDVRRWHPKVPAMDERTASVVDLRSRSARSPDQTSFRMRRPR